MTKARARRDPARRTSSQSGSAHAAPSLGCAESSSAPNGVEPAQPDTERDPHMDRLPPRSSRNASGKCLRRLHVRSAADLGAGSADAAGRRAPGHAGRRLGSGSSVGSRSWCAGPPRPSRCGRLARARPPRGRPGSRRSSKARGTRQPERCRKGVATRRPSRGGLCAAIGGERLAYSGSSKTCTDSALARFLALPRAPSETKASCSSESQATPSRFP